MKYVKAFVLGNLGTWFIAGPAIYASRGWFMKPEDIGFVWFVACLAGIFVVWATKIQEMP